MMTREEAINGYVIPAIKNTWNEKKCGEIIEALEQQPCEDCISRQAVLDTIYNCKSTFENNLARGFFIDKIKELSPVTPQPKTEVLDKIRAEIKGKYRVILKGTPKDDWAVRWNDCVDEVLEIIDKYRSEDKG